MRKTSVYLDDADARRLAMLAEREGISQASLLRKAIRAYVPQPRGSRTFALVIAAPVTAEVDYLLGQRIGRSARLAFLEDLAAGRFVARFQRKDCYC